MFGLIGTTTLGKTRLSEYGFSASAEYMDDPPVRNPWHTGHTSGASSAGSGAFVAAGAVPMAHANDGGGSHPDPGRLLRAGGAEGRPGDASPSDKLNREMPVKIVHDGVVTRSVRDTAAFLRESERVYRNLKLPPVGDVTGPGKKRLRVALVTELHRRPEDRRGDRAGRAAHRRTARGARPHDRGRSTRPCRTPSRTTSCSTGARSRSFRRVRRASTRSTSTYDRSRNDNLTKGLARHAAKNAWRLPLAIARLNLSHRKSKHFFADHDVVLTPTMSLVTPELGWLDPSQSYETVMGRLLEWVAFTPLQNATGDPAISLPMGMSTKGLPIGVHLAAERGHDRRLLQVAYELEEAQPFARIQD